MITVQAWRSWRRMIAPAAVQVVEVTGQAGGVVYYETRGGAVGRAVAEGSYAVGAFVRVRSGEVVGAATGNTVTTVPV